MEQAASSLKKVELFKKREEAILALRFEDSLSKAHSRIPTAQKLDHFSELIDQRNHYI